jgi:hypothetical protein
MRFRDQFLTVLIIIIVFEVLPFGIYLFEQWKHRGK